MAETKEETYFTESVDPIDSWPKDREALDAIFAALKPFDQEARSRILRAVAVFYDLV